MLYISNRSRPDPFTKETNYNYSSNPISSDSPSTCPFSNANDNSLAFRSSSKIKRERYLAFYTTTY
jgi:hypothetical protein